MSGDPFAPMVAAQGFVVLDGGLASALEEGGYRLHSALWSAEALLDAPDRVRAVHDAFLAAGADCITTAGYQASFEGLAAAGLDRAGAERVLGRAVSIAVEARDEFWADPANREGRLRPLVAASVGPYGAMLADGSEYDGRYGVPTDVLARHHAARLDLLSRTAADVLAFETVPSVAEVRVLARLLAERAGTPAWISVSCRDAERLRDGTPVEQAVSACGPAGERLVGIGVNCTSPRHVAGLVRSISSCTDLAVLAYPNSGEEYDSSSKSWIGRPDAWIDEAPAWFRSGARVVGGCCRVGPSAIRELRTKLLEETHAR